MKYYALNAFFNGEPFCASSGSFGFGRLVWDSEAIYASLRSGLSGMKTWAEILDKSDVEKEVIWDTRNGEEDGTHKIQERGKDGIGERKRRTVHEKH